jgi:hypothetical protein
MNEHMKFAEDLAELLTNYNNTCYNTIYGTINKNIVRDIIAEDEVCDRMLKSLMKLIRSKHKNTLIEMVLEAYPFARHETSKGEHLSANSTDEDVEELVKPMKAKAEEIYGIDFDEEKVRNILFELRYLMREYNEEYAFDIMLGRRNTDLELIEE